MQCLHLQYECKSTVHDQASNDNRRQRTINVSSIVYVCDTMKSVTSTIAIVPAGQFSIIVLMSWQRWTFPRISVDSFYSQLNVFIVESSLERGPASSDHRLSKSSWRAKERRETILSRNQIIFQTFLGMKRDVHIRWNRPFRLLEKIVCVQSIRYDSLSAHQILWMNYFSLSFLCTNTNQWAFVHQPTRPNRKFR